MNEKYKTIIITLVSREKSNSESCNFSTTIHQTNVFISNKSPMIMKQIAIFGVTFASFAVNSDDVFGIGRHPLPHACCVFQHVPGTDSRTRNDKGIDTSWKALMCSCNLMCSSVISSKEGEVKQK